MSEYYLASANKEALELANRLFRLMEEKAYDKQFGGYLEFFNGDWTPTPADEQGYMGPAGLKLMNTHLHMLEAMTTYCRASKSPIARERLLELIAIESNSVVRKDLGACTDKYERTLPPRVEGPYARVSYGHDLENVWLIIDACHAAGVSPWPYLDLFKALWSYSLKYGYDAQNGGFYDDGAFNQPSGRRNRRWWVQAEAIVSALYMHDLTREARYLDVFRKTYDSPTCRRSRLRVSPPTRAAIFSHSACCCMNCWLDAARLTGATDLEVLQRIIHGSAQPLGPEIPLALGMVVEKALEKDPAERYHSMRELVVDLRRLARQSGEAAASPPPRQRQRWKRAVLPSVLLPVLLVAGFFAWRAWRAPERTEPLRAVPLTTQPGVHRYPSFFS